MEVNDMFEGMLFAIGIIIGIILLAIFGIIGLVSLAKLIIKGFAKGIKKFIKWCKED
jgi:hypothetical protein